VEMIGSFLPACRSQRTNSIFGGTRRYFGSWTLNDILRFLVFTDILEEGAARIPASAGAKVSALPPRTTVRRGHSK
jgi:hypothetical protein